MQNKLFIKTILLLTILHSTFLAPMSFAITSNDSQNCSYLFSNAIFSNAQFAIKHKLYNNTPITHITSLDSNGFEKIKKLHPSEIVPNSQLYDLYLVFEILHNTPHVTLHFNNKVYSGNIMKTAKIHTLNPLYGHSIALIDQGIIIRIKNIEQKMLSDIVRYFNKTQSIEVFTCSQGACKILQQNGIVIKGRGNFYPSKMITNLLEHGITVQKNNQSSHDPNIDFFSYNISIEKYLDFAHNKELYITFDEATKYIPLTILLYMSAWLGFSFLFH